MTNFLNDWFHLSCGWLKIHAEQWDGYAEDYHDFVISPLRKGIDNPIYSLIEKINDRKKLVAGDLGCGRGEFIPFLSKNFKHVHAMDFSKNMVDIAKRKNNHKNISIFKGDLRKLGDYKLELDVAFSINSILLPDPRDIKKIFHGLYDSINTGGMFIGIFPSMESIIYYSTLIHEREFARHEDMKKSLTMARRKAERSKYSFIQGIYDDKGEKQKFFYEWQIEKRLEDAGFRNIKFKKVKYPWSMSGDFDSFEGRKRMWDWLVVARK